MNKLISKLYDKKIDGTGLAIFRILFSLVFLGDVLYLFYFRHLIFDKVPFLEFSEVAIWPVFVFWIPAIIFIIIGLYTKVATIVNYILTVIVLGTISSYEYHMYYSYLIIFFLFIFLPISNSLSIDRLREKIKYSNTRFKYNPSIKVSVLNYFILITFGIGVVYLDSVFFKLGSDLWLKGLGVWLPATVPQASFINITPILNIKPLVLFLGYFTIFFEAVFLFVFWRKKWRIPVLIAGVALHMGILICFPIPFFALGVMCLYLLMIPASFWEKIFIRKTTDNPNLKFYYDAECPLCNRTQIVISHFDISNKIKFLTVQEKAVLEPQFEGISQDELLSNIYSVDRKGNVFVGVDTYIKVFNSIWFFKPIAWTLSIPGIYHISKRIYSFVAVNRTTERCTEDNCGFTVPDVPVKESQVKILENLTLKDFKVKLITFGVSILLLLQIGVSYNSGIFSQLKTKLGIVDTGFVQFTNSISSGIHMFSKPLLGVTRHPLFMDGHFNSYNHTIAVVYKDGEREIWLPIIDERGTPGKYLFGPNWAKWTFRVNSPHINQNTLSNGIRDFTAFWAHKNNISLDEAVFKIKVKKVETPKEWEKDFLNKQIANPWLDGGEVLWKNKAFYSDIKNIEEM